MKQALNQKLAPLISLLYGALIIYFYWSGSLAFLVNPVYNKLILAGGLSLLILGLYWLANRKEYHSGSCDQEEKSGLGLLILLTLPLLSGIFFTPQPLSSASALLRGVSSDLSSASFDPIAFAKPASERTLMEWVRLINVDPEPSHYQGQMVAIEGNVILDEKLPQNMFHLGRHLLTCCVADARFVALPIVFDASTFTPINDSWIKVEGFMEEGLIDGNRHVVVQLESATDIPIPDDAYEFFE